MAGYKQECPSCGAKVPIKDESLVGKKIDCHKCKYRFIVEAPADSDVSAAAEETPKKKKAVAADTAKTPAVATKVKKEKKDAAPADDADDDKPKKPKKKKDAGGPPTVAIGIGIGVVALIALGIGAYFIFFSDDAPPKKSTPPKGDAPIARGAGRNNPTPDQPKQDDQPVNPTVAAPGKLIEPSNLIPKSTLQVLSVDIGRFNDSLFSRAMFSASGFKREMFKEHMGVAFDNISRFILATNSKDSWAFSVLRLKSAVGIDEIKTAFNLTKPPETVGGKQYYEFTKNELIDALVTANNTNLNEVKGPAKPAAKTTTMLVCLFDSQTLFIGDSEPMREMLKEWNNPKYKQSKLGAAPPPDPNQPPAAPPPQAPGRTLPGGRGTVAPPPPANPPANQGGNNNALFTTSDTWMTLNPNLKALLDKLESNKQFGAYTFVVDFANDAKFVLELRKQIAQEIVKQSGPAAAAAAMVVPIPVSAFGVSLLKLNNGQATASLSVELTTADMANTVHSEAKKVIPIFAASLAYAMQQRIDLFGVAEGGQTQTIIPVPRGQGGIPGMPPGGPEVPPPGTPGTPPVAVPSGPAKSSIALSIVDRAVHLAADLELPDQLTDQLYDEMRTQTAKLKGVSDMVVGGPKWHLVASGGKDGFQKAGQFPQGALPRTISESRMGRPYKPNDRLSWMVELLPHIGRADVYRDFVLEQSWRTDTNLTPASVWVTEFLNPFYPRSTWSVKLTSDPGRGRDVGATHYVGLAGVGLDAASYSEKDPSVAKKIGVFGYDRPLKWSDVKDGTGNTAFMAQVPPGIGRPWAVGGGATIQGVPEKNSVAPFVTKIIDGPRKGETGTMILMLDGSVRFVSDKVSDKVFQAMVTVNGEDNPDLLELDTVAPKVPPPGAKKPTTTTTPNTLVPGKQ